MNRLAFVSTGVACVLAFAPAVQATTFHIGEPNFLITTGTPTSSTITAAFFNAYASPISFNDSFLFTIPQDGIGSGSISTSFSSSSNQLVIEQLLINGVSYPLISLPSGQSAEVGGVPIINGALNTFQVIGHTLGEGGVYSGTATFTAAIPEPATWAFMIAGFAAVGASLRRRRPARVSFS